MEAPQKREREENCKTTSSPAARVLWNEKPWRGAAGRRGIRARWPLTLAWIEAAAWCWQMRWTRSVGSLRAWSDKISI